MTCKSELLTALLVQEGYNLTRTDQKLLMVEESFVINGEMTLLWLFNSKNYTGRSPFLAFTVCVRRDRAWDYCDGRPLIKCNDNEIKQGNRLLSDV